MTPSRDRTGDPQRVLLEPGSEMSHRSRIWDDGLGRVATRSLQVLFVVAVVYVAIEVAVRLRLLVVPLLIAIVLAAAVNPLVDWLGRRRVPRTLAVWLTLVVGFGIVGGLGWWIGASVQEQWGRLTQAASRGLDQLQSYLAHGPLPLSPQDVEQARQWVGNAVSGSQQNALSGATMVLHLLTGLVLALVLLFFLLKDGRSMWSFVSIQLPRRNRNQWDEAAERSSTVLGRYVRGIAIVALVDAVLIGAALLVLGVPLALPLAVLVFLGAFIPIIGATVTGALAALVALVSGGLVTALIVVGVVVVVQQVEGNVVAPLVYGQAISFHPVAILLALTAGTIVAGIIGAVLAVPVAGVLWTFLTTFRETRPTEPPPLP
jgi:predicted PurR-regulated permease PerM